MTKNTELEEIALNLRKKIIEISYISKAHHIGSELSCIDILVSLYFKIMNIYPKVPTHKDRDYFILSKGHAALALYVTLMQRGFFSENFLKNEFLSNGGQLGGHPDKNLDKGIEISTGSLGQGLSIAAGIALMNKKDNKKCPPWIIKKMNNGKVIIEVKILFCKLFIFFQSFFLYCKICLQFY